MKTFRKLDQAEVWLAKQYLGSEVIIFRNNIEFVRLKLKRKVFKDIRRLLATANLKPPFDPKEIAKFRKVLHITEDPGLVSREACLIPTNGGFIIRLNPRITKLKKRYNCAHEIGHTYFYDLSANPPRRPYSSNRYWVEEGYVREITREIIMPEPDLSTFVLKHNFSLSVPALAELSKRFKVSYGLLGERLLHDAHSLNKEFWDENAWEGIIVIAVGKSYESNQSRVLSTSKVDVYRSPQYKHRFADVTSNKIEKAFESKVKGSGFGGEIARLIFNEFTSRKGEIKKQIFSRGRFEYCSEVGRVNERCVLCVIYKNKLDKNV